MKKALSVIIAIVLLAPCIPVVGVRSFAAELTTVGSQIPIVTISGDGESICDAEGNRLLNYRDIGKAFSSNDNGDADVSGAAKTIIRTLANGYITGDFSEYYDTIYKEISDLFEEIQLDKDGNPRNGTDISSECRRLMAESGNRDSREGKGYYGFGDYRFWYDWRLDPLQIADELNDYITNVKAATGVEKVSVISRCLGSQVLLAYIAKYGTDDIYGVCINGGTVGGSEPLSETICGKFTIDGRAALRLYDDLVYYGVLDSFDEYTEQTIEMLVKTGVVDGTVDVVRETLYKHIAQGATSAIARATFFGFPCYWASVKEKDYPNAINYVFGEEGSEKRQEYAGLIAKLDNYDKVVRRNIPTLMKEIKDAGCKVCVIAKYGVQMIPTCESMNLVGDQIASLQSAAFGATTSFVLDTLPQSYIEQKTLEGLGKYISPDKQVDASTCLWRDNTWFVKGVTHSYWTSCEDAIAYTVTTADRQLTIDDFDLGQFISAIPLRDEQGNIRFDWGKDKMTYEFVKMTEENCHVESWADDVKVEKDFLTRLIDSIKTFFRWFRMSLSRLFVTRN